MVSIRNVAIGKFLLILCLVISVYAEEQEPAPEAIEPKALEPKSEEPKTSSLPSMETLVSANIKALQEKLLEQNEEINKAQVIFEKERIAESNIVNENAYFSLSIVNNAPSLEYRLEKTFVYIDGKQVAWGNRSTFGLPKNAAEIFFGPLAPGCHELMVKASYTRLKNHLINQFKVNRFEKVIATQAFVTKSSHTVEIEVEIFEKVNSLAQLFRGANVRFNKLVRPNFLKGAPLLSAEDILAQGRFEIHYRNEGDLKHHRLLRHSLSIDGLPLFVDKQQSDGHSLFNGSIAEGKHTLDTVLLFSKDKWVKGGPVYNFRLRFSRDFYVINGKTTVLNLIADPKDGFATKGSAKDISYAKVSSQITANEQEEFFPKERCTGLTQKAIAE